LYYAQLGGYGNAFAISNQVRNPAQQFVLTHWLIRNRKRITLRDPFLTSGIARSPDNAMRAKSSLALNQNDITHPDLILTEAFHHQRLSGPNGRQHAPTSRGKAKRAERTQNFARKFALYSAFVACPCVHGSGQEAERFCEQLRLVAVILPQDKAEVTKTWSYRKLGFWYGFFPEAADFTSVFDKSWFDKSWFDKSWFDESWFDESFTSIKISSLT
jgi:hypothetical protein